MVNLLFRGPEVLADCSCIRIRGRCVIRELTGSSRSRWLLPLTCLREIICCLFALRRLSRTMIAEPGNQDCLMVWKPSWIYCRAALIKSVWVRARRHETSSTLLVRITKWSDQPEKLAPLLPCSYCLVKLFVSELNRRHTRSLVSLTAAQSPRS